MPNGPGAGANEPTRLVDPTTGRPILMAQKRQQRPFLTGAHRSEAACPFCPGAEDQTPPEIDRIDGDDGRWDARAFANKYPASRWHEVIAEGAVHEEQAGRLDARTWARVVQMWQRRIAALEAQPDVGCAFLFKNVGAPAGASIAHSHSQILGLPEPPPRLLLEQRVAQDLGRCPWCEDLQNAHAEGRVVVAGPNHVALCPNPPKLPNETWVLPRRCDDDFLATDPAALGQTLQRLFAALDRALSAPAFNLWLHRLPGAAFHWHFELQPRTGQLAGLELGGDMYINSFPADAAAARMRAALP